MNERPSQQHESRSFWDEVAATDRRGVIPGLLEANSELAKYRDAAEKRVLLERLRGRLSASTRVFEGGCGGGRWTTWLARRAASVTASDISTAMIERVQARVDAAGLHNVTLHARPLDEMDPQQEFDLIYFGSCLQYMSDSAVRTSFERSAHYAEPNAVLLCRDTVSLLGRPFHRSERYSGDDPAIYRTPEYYEDLAWAHGWRRIDRWSTYAPAVARGLKRVLPGFALRALLSLELPLAARRVAYRDRRPPSGDKRHQFALYERAPRS